MLENNPILKVLVPALEKSTYVQMLEFTEYLSDTAQMLYTGELASTEYAEIFAKLAESYRRYLDDEKLVNRAVISDFTTVFPRS